MDTRKAAMEYRITHWMGIMREQKESGLSIKEYCEQMGMHENKYYYWQRRLREMAINQINTQSGEATNNLVPKGFAEVKLAKATGQEAGNEETAEIKIETNGIKITACSAYPAGKLAQFVRELARP